MSTYLGFALEMARPESTRYLLEHLFEEPFVVVEHTSPKGMEGSLWEMPEDSEQLVVYSHEGFALLVMHDDVFDDLWMELGDTIRKNDHRLACGYVFNDTAMALGVEVLESGRSMAQVEYEHLTTGVKSQGSDVLDLAHWDQDGDLLDRLEHQMGKWFFPQGMPQSGWKRLVLQRMPGDAGTEATPELRLQEVVYETLRVRSFQGLPIMGFVGEEATEETMALVNERLDPIINELSMQADSTLHETATKLEWKTDRTPEESLRLFAVLALLHKRKPAATFPVRISAFENLPQNVNLDATAPDAVADEISSPAPVPTGSDTTQERSPWARPSEETQAQTAEAEPVAEPPTQPAYIPKPEASGPATRTYRREEAKVLIKKGNTLKAREIDPEYDVMCFLRDEAAANVLKPLKPIHEYPQIAERLPEIEAGGQTIPELSFTARRVRLLSTSELSGHLSDLRKQPVQRSVEGLLPFDHYLELNLVKGELARRNQAVNDQKIRDRQREQMREHGGSGSGMTGWEVVRIILVIIGLLLAIGRIFFR